MDELYTINRTQVLVNYLWT